MVYLRTNGIIVADTHSQTGIVLADKLLLLHAGHNLTATLLAVYCASGLGELQMSKTPVIILPDTKVLIACALTTLIGLYLILNHKALNKSK